MSDVVIRVEGVSKLYRLGEVGTGSLAHDVNRWWHRVRGKEDPYLKIGEVNDRTKTAKQARTDSGSRRTEGTTNHTKKHENLTTEDTTERLGRGKEEQTKFGPKGEGAGATESKNTEGTAGGNQRADSAKFLEGHSQAGLQMDSEKPASIRSANAPSATRSQNGLNSESAKIGEICGKTSENFNLKTENSAPKAQSDWVYALKDVSFEVKRGEVLGIIGRNGAGKSTLLKILSRVTTQSEGRIKVRGRIASLLEVGTGFHPELTGRENIFLNGAILGMRKAEIARKFDEIVEFSGCARYIDTPVKRYSSGMYVRLAFAVTAHLEPEILIVDEVLAVGDAEFQKKCLGKMKDVAGHGRTILFVSHNMQAVKQLCSKAIVIGEGQLKFQGNVHDAATFYMAQSMGRHNLNFDLATYPRTLKCPGVRLEGFSVLDGTDSPLLKINRNSEVKIQLNIKVDFQIENVDIAIVLTHAEGSHIFSECYSDEFQKVAFSPGNYTISFTLPLKYLKLESYFFSINIFDEKKVYDFVEGIPLPEIADEKSDHFLESKRWGLVRLPIKWGEIIKN